MRIHFAFIAIFALFSECHSYQKGCKGMIPSIVEKPPSRNEADKYMLHISGTPKKFVPYEHYNISLKLSPIHEDTQHRFKNFIVSIEQTYDEDHHIHSSPGKLMIGYDGLSRFSELCENTLVESNTLPKSRVNFAWRAPEKGCVIIRASVVESKDSWYTDTDDLRKVLCEDSEESDDKQPTVLRRCCACDEAKYEMAFEGTWSRNTHPKDFPADPFDTHFSDVVGASHKYGGSFWRVGDRASPGLGQLASNSSTSLLEAELNRESENIRTIIKARGLKAPNPTDTTYALFRVDRENHLISLVSRFAPSPDWFVGVHDLELCRQNCTWEESKTLNLYPFDAGVMEGISYESPAVQVYEPEMIRGIKPNSPNDIRAPFFDESGASIKPIARLHLTRQKLYERECSGEVTDEESDVYCETTEWSEWSECSRTCGVGSKFRTRKLINNEKQNECIHIPKTDETPCHVVACYGSKEHDDQYTKYSQPEENTENPEGENTEAENKVDAENVNPEACNTTDWDFWSECSVSCGKGHKVRDRKLINEENTENCAHVELQETQECESQDCRPYEPPAVICKGKEWMEWEECSASCDTSGENVQRISEGYRTRYSKPEVDERTQDDDDDESEHCPYKETVKCYIHCAGGPFNGISAGNYIVEGATGDVIDCMTSSWSVWSDCEMIGSGEQCGNGWRTKKRTILVHPENGGRPCPRRLFVRERCKVPCVAEEEEGEKKEEEEEEQANTEGRCVMGPWSEWSPCTNNCGKAVQIRTRAILREGPDCLARFEKKECQLPIGCDPYGYPNFH